jgi:hypothetical protein
MSRFLIPVALIASAFIGCGDGGGGGIGGLATSAFNGVAVDGYLHNARAFLDLNNNGIYDAGEPTAMTNSSGGFTLEATQAQIDAYPVVVVAIAGTTIDQDSPGAPMTSGMTLMSPPGNHSVVSPLTTQVVAKMATGLSLADAKTAVQTDLGLTGIDLMKDFVAEKTTNPAYAEAHRIAVSVADVLKTVESESTSSTSLTDRLANARTKVASDVVPQVALIKQATSNSDALAAMKAIAWQSSGNLATYDNCSSDIAPLQLEVSAIKKSDITFSLNSGSLPTGLTIASDGKITGVPAAVSSNRISTFTVAANRQGGSTVVSGNLSITVNVSGVFFNNENGHFYKHVEASGMTWDQVRALAESTSCKGQTGYLATIINDSELTFIDAVVYASGKPRNVFIGGSDFGHQSNWRWKTGPEGLLEGGLGARFSWNFSGNNLPPYISPWDNSWDKGMSGYDYVYIYYLSDTLRFHEAHNIKMTSPILEGGMGGYLIEYGN